MLYLSAASRPTDASGAALPFGRLTFLAEGTTELAVLESGENPTVADVDGIFPEVILADGVHYRVRLEDRHGRLIYDCPAYRPYATGSFTYLDAQVRALDDTGRPIPGATLSFTDTDGNPVASFADAACTVPQTHPVIADAGGLFAPIYLRAGSYLANGEPYPPPPVGLTPALIAMQASQNGDLFVWDSADSLPFLLDMIGADLSDRPVAFGGSLSESIQFFDENTLIVLFGELGNTRYRIVVVSLAGPVPADLFSTIDLAGSLLQASFSFPTLIPDYLGEDGYTGLGYWLRDWNWWHDTSGLEPGVTYPVVIA